MAMLSMGSVVARSTQNKNLQPDASANRSGLTLWLLLCHGCLVPWIVCFCKPAKACLYIEFCSRSKWNAMLFVNDVKGTQAIRLISCLSNAQDITSSNTGIRKFTWGNYGQWAWAQTPYQVVDQSRQQKTSRPAKGYKKKHDVAIVDVHHHFWPTLALHTACNSFWKAASIWWQAQSTQHWEGSGMPRWRCLSAHSARLQNHVTSKHCNTEGKAASMQWKAHSTKRDLEYRGDILQCA